MDHIRVRKQRYFHRIRWSNQRPRSFHLEKQRLFNQYWLRPSALRKYHSSISLKFLENLNQSNNLCFIFFVQNIKFNHAKNIIVRGLTSVDPKGFHIHVYACHNIRFQKLQLNAPEESPNTDGIHTSNSSYIKITKSKISTGDDCVSVGQGSSNIYVSDVTCAVRDTGSGNV